MSGPLTIVVDADVTNATAKIGQFTYTVKKEFGNLQKAVNSTTKSFAYNTKQMEGSVANVGKSSRVALTNLSLVLQDLPYGFIGIQNNLPFLTQSFGQLSTAAGGTTNALKAMGAGLFGPAGLFLAISAVTAAVTFATQKYGSLGEAYNAIINKTGQLTENQKEIAKQVAEESTKVITLFGLYNTLSGSREQQINIIKKLKEISPEYFGQLDAEKTKIDQLKESIDKYIDSFVGKIFVENQQKLVNDLLAKYAERITTVINKQIEVEKQNKKNIKGANDFVKVLEDIAKGQERAPGDISVGIKPVIEKQTFQEAIDNLKKELSKELTGVFDIGKSFKDFINIPGIFGEIKKQADGVKKEKILDLETFVNPLTREFVEQQAKSFEKFWNDLKKRVDKRIEDSTEALDKFRKKASDPFTAVGPGAFVPSAEEQARLDQLEKIKQRFAETKNFLMAVFFNPLEDAFMNFFETGKFAFKSFGDAILKEIQRIVSRIIATQIIQLLAKIIDPTGAFVTGGMKIGEIIGSAIGGRNLGRPNTPAFNPGAMNFAGNVALTLRGSDLVAAMNRTNTTINRVG